MASYPYYQPPPWKAKQTPTAPMPRATNKPPAARPKVNQEPVAQNIEGSGEGVVEEGFDAAEGCGAGGGLVVLGVDVFDQVCEVDV